MTQTIPLPIPQKRTPPCRIPGRHISSGSRGSSGIDRNTPKKKCKPQATSTRDDGDGDVTSLKKQSAITLKELEQKKKKNTRRGVRKSTATWVRTQQQNACRPKKRVQPWNSSRGALTTATSKPRNKPFRASCQSSHQIPEHVSASSESAR